MHVFVVADSDFSCYSGVCGYLVQAARGSSEIL